MRPIRIALLVVPAALTPFTGAQDLLATRVAPARIERYDGATGGLVNASFIDIDGLLGFAGAPQNVWEVIAAPGGEWWVSNYTAQAVHRFSSDGSAYLGDVPITPGRAVGIAIQAGKLWVASVGGATASGVYGYDLATFTQTDYEAVTNAWDVHPYGADLLISRSSGVVDRYDLALGTIVPFASPTGFCEQAYTRSTGHLLVANFGLTGYDEIDPTGAVTLSHPALGLGSIRGVAELGNGSVMLNGTGGLWLFDPASGATTQLSAGNGAFIGVASGFSYSVHCTSNPNSTGAVAALAGMGSNSVAANDVTLAASALPLNAFGYFLASLSAGNVANPGGSQGVLCLGGSIGRYVGPGQVQNSGATGAFSLQLDLTSMPQPGGSIPVAPGQTWFFQAWFRDAVGGSATSNFTDGIAVGF